MNIHRAPTCPTCHHEMSADEMNANAEDLWAIAPNEERAVIKCPSCDVEYHCQGGCQPEYVCAIDEDDL